jgi:hypothetical protein
LRDVSLSQRPLVTLSFHYLTTVAIKTVAPQAYKTPMVVFTRSFHATPCAMSILSQNELMSLENNFAKLLDEEIKNETEEGTPPFLAPEFEDFQVNTRV